MRRSVVILNCSLSPNGLMRQKAEWAIDSEAMRVRGIIIVLVKSNYLVKKVIKLSRQNNLTSKT